MLLAHIKGKAFWCQCQIHLPVVVSPSLQFSCVCFFRDLLNFVTYLITGLLCLPLVLSLPPEKGPLRPWWELMTQKPNLKWVHGDMGLSVPPESGRVSKTEVGTWGAACKALPFLRLKFSVNLRWLNLAVGQNKKHFRTTIRLPWENPGTS